MLAELADVLSRPVPANRLALFHVTARQCLADYIEAVDLVTPLATPHIVPDDPDDDHVIAAAIAANANIIASGDKHLLGLGIHHDILILLPADVLVTINKTAE